MAYLSLIPNILSNLQCDNKVKCRHNAVQFITTLHTAVWEQWHKENQISETEQTPHISPSQASYRGHTKRFWHWYEKWQPRQFCSSVTQHNLPPTLNTLLSCWYCIYTRSVEGWVALRYIDIQQWLHILCIGNKTDEWRRRLGYPQRIIFDLQIGCLWQLWWFHGLQLR